MNLSLGRLTELWNLQILGEKRRVYGQNIIRKAQIEGLINSNQAKLLQAIKREYDLIKHAYN
ncbi:MAG: hypothetical protein ACFE96_18045 [Candidatus Hermodarchaeota archaeon]